MPIEINAGETFNVNCPTNERPILVFGEKLPDSKNTLAKVLKIQKETATLGPYKTGSILLTIPCSNSKLSIEVNVKELNSTDTSRRFSSLNAQKVDLPLEFFIILFALILGISLSFFYLRKKKQVQNLPKESKAPTKDPRLELKKHLAYCESTVKNPETIHFHDTYKLLRKFLEKENKLNTRSLTTGEFIGTFRALGIKQSSNQQFISQLEHVLKTSDDVRFAGKSVTPQIWQDYLSQTKAILLAFPSKDQPIKSTESTKK